MGKSTILILVGAVALSACASTSTPERESLGAAVAPAPLQHANSRIIESVPYTTQGVKVLRAGNWYLGDNGGLTAQMVPGGVHYTASLAEAPATTQDGASVALAEEASAEGGGGLSAGASARTPDKAPARGAAPQEARGVAALAQAVHQCTQFGTCGPLRYTVQRGDYLWRIALALYASPYDWRAIYAANRHVIGDNPDLIYPGQVFVLQPNVGG